MAHDVFISHSSTDKAVADAVCHRLEAAGIRCWIAPRDVLVGMDWDDAIVKAVAEAKIFIVIFSAAANGSRVVRNEVVAAVGANSIIFPFRIEQVTPSGGMELHLNRVHWLDAMTSPLEAHIDKLVENAKRVLGDGLETTAPPRAEPAPAAKPEAAKTNSTRAVALGFVAGAAVLLAGGAAYLLLRDHGTSAPTVVASAPVASPPAAAPVTIPPAIAPPQPAAPAAPATPAAVPPTPPAATPAPPTATAVPAPAPPASTPLPAPSTQAAIPPQPASPPVAAAEFIFPDSDRRPLSAQELAGLPCAQLEYARNEIYARRGRRFVRADLREHFFQFSWYRPYTFEVSLSGVEQGNVALIAGAESQQHCR